MRITGFDVLAFAVGAIAVVFSGFVLAYSTAGGLALVVAGALALALPFLRADEGSTALGALVWLAIVGLIAAGIGGFLLGVGVFDDHDVRWESNATHHDLDGNRSLVVVTGTVSNDGDGAAENAAVTATLVDDGGTELRARTKRFPPLPPNSTGMFYFRFVGDDEPQRFEDADVEITVGVEASE